MTKTITTVFGRSQASALRTMVQIRIKKTVTTNEVRFKAKVVADVPMSERLGRLPVVGHRRRKGGFPSNILSVIFIKNKNDNNCSYDFLSRESKAQNTARKKTREREREIGGLIDVNTYRTTNYKSWSMAIRFKAVPERAF